MTPPDRPERHLALVIDARDAQDDAPPSDDTLMALAAAGDRRAFAVLVTRHEARLRRLGTLLTGDAERARELAQDTLVLAWERRACYRPEGRLGAWLAGIVRNLAARERRKQRVRAFFGLASASGSAPTWTTPEPERDGYDHLVAADRERVLAAALQRLPAKMREAIALRFVEGLDYDAMAAVLGTSASTLRSRVHHGLAQLAARVPEEILR